MMQALVALCLGPQDAFTFLLSVLTRAHASLRCRLRSR